MVKFGKLLITAVSLLTLMLPYTCFADDYEYIISEEFDELPENFEINLNDLDMSGHAIYAEDSILYLSKAGDVGNPEIKTSFEPIKENVIVEFEMNMDDANFSVLDSSGQKVIDFYNGTGNNYNKLEMRIDSQTKLRFNYVRGDWCKVKFVIDLENDKFSPYINGSDTPLTTEWKLMGERDDVAGFVFLQKEAGKTSAIKNLKIYRDPVMAVGKDIEYFNANILPGIERVSEDTELPQKALLGSSLSWESEDEDVFEISLDGLKGIVKRGAEDTTVTLRVTFSLNGYYKEHIFDIVVARAQNDEEKVQNAYDKLVLENTDYIADDFILPEMGFDNTQIEWISSDTEVIEIDGNNAIVKSISADKNVTLTAKIISGELFREKSFTVGVLADLGENLATSADIIPSTEISTNKASEVTDNNYYSGWKSVPVEAAPALLIDLKEDKAVSHIRYRPIGSAGNVFKVFLSNDNINFETVDTFEYSDGVRVIELERISQSRYVKIEIENPNNTECGVYEAEICCQPNAKQIVSADALEFSFDDISSESVDSIKDDLNLMLTGKYGSDITYSSSDSDLIEIYKDEGIVRRPDGKADKNVILTVKFSKDGVSEEIKLSLVVIATGKSSSGGSSSGGGGGGGGGSSSSGFRTFGDAINAQTDNTVETKPADEITQGAENKGYKDLKSVPWAEAYINELSEKGIISGDGDGKFRPDDNVKREEFVLMLVKALNIELEENGVGFTDVGNTHWSSKYVNTAAVLGIVSGMEENTFGIGRSITRQDMAVMMYRAIKDKYSAGENKGTDFADIKYVSDYAKDAALALADAGIMSGDENGLFNPKNNATRAETAVAIARLISFCK